MQDNFDLKGYLRHGNKLLNEGIGGYMDLKPINKLNEDDDDYDKSNDEPVTEVGQKPRESTTESEYKGNDPYDKEYDLPGIDDKPGYDVFGGYHGPRIKNAVVSLVRSGYAEGDIVHYVRAVIKAAKNLKN